MKSLGLLLNKTIGKNLGNLPRDFFILQYLPINFFKNQPLLESEVFEASLNLFAPGLILQKFFWVTFIQEVTASLSGTKKIRLSLS